MNATDTMIDAEARVLDGLSSLHTQIIDANQQAFNRLTELAENAPKIPSLTEMPDAPEAVKRSYEFAGKIFNAQHDFAEQMLTVWYPAPAKATKAKTAAK